MGRVATALALVCALAAVRRARAEPTVVRFGTVAPEGTAWARELHGWARDVEQESGGAVHLKLYFGAIAGDEPEVAARIRRGQLDGVIGSICCYDVAPSLRVATVIGLLQGRDEWSWLVNRLRPTLDEEFQASGFVNLGVTGIGSIIVFSRKPIASMLQLRMARLVVWERDQAVLRQLPAIGVHAEALPLAEGARAYTDGRVDGFLAPAAAAMAFQWSSLTRYFTDLRVSFVAGCGMMSLRSFDALPLEAQKAIRATAAKLARRYDQVAREQDDALLGGLFERQGMRRVPVDERFRGEFFEATQSARERLSEQIVPAELLRKVVRMLADYRAAHH